MTLQIKIVIRWKSAWASSLENIHLHASLPFHHFCAQSSRAYPVEIQKCMLLCSTLICPLSILPLQNAFVWFVKMLQQKVFFYRNFQKSCLKYARNAVLFESSEIIITSANNNTKATFCRSSEILWVEKYFTNRVCISNIGEF